MKIAGVQMDVTFGKPEENIEKMVDRLREAAEGGARLAVFPECALTGYCYESLEEAKPQAQPVPGPAADRMAKACAQLGTYAVFGLLESDGDRLFNSCALVGPGEIIGVYRKIHLPFLGVDRFVTPGDKPFQIWEIEGVRMGMNICYDASFPESSRVMALMGADLIVLPTNWPPGAAPSAAYLPQTRALENNIYYLAANRVGEERGFHFIGKSKICAPNGKVLTEADHDRESLILAEMDPEWARRKRQVNIPGVYELDRIGDRRPEMYEVIVESGREE